MQIGLEKAVRIGRDLKALMQSEAAAIALQVMKEDYQLRVFNTEPHDTATREQAYYEARGLEGFISTINSFIHVADAQLAEDVDNTEY
jgi:hypothetical protein